VPRVPQENDDPAWVRRQAQLGVHAAIVDDVPGVLAGLAASGPLPTRAAAAAAVAAAEAAEAGAVEVGSLGRVLSGEGLAAMVQGGAPAFRVGSAG
jgi:hypothetical protein